MAHNSLLYIQAWKLKLIEKAEVLCMIQSYCRNKYQRKLQKETDLNITCKINLQVKLKDN